MKDPKPQMGEGQHISPEPKEKLSGSNPEEAMAVDTQPLSEKKARQNAEEEYKKWEEAEKRRIRGEEERERNKFTCRTCGERKDAKDLALSSQSGGTCRDCAAVS